MGRPIKFRVWYKDNQFMAYDVLSRLDEDIKNGHPIMQFSGLFDRNGKEVYEGDIIRSRNICYSTKEHFVERIFWSEDSCGFYRVNQYMSFNPLTRNIANNSEVIGNIWENPELLKEIK